MRKATKIVLSFAVILIAGLNFIVPAFAQDPFSAIAVGGLTGASGAGLFGSMAGASGINIGWSNSGSDPMDAMWNVLNPDHVYFSGEKHEATNIGEDIYDWIDVDIGDWLSAQRDFIQNFVTTYNVTDNSSGSVQNQDSFDGVPIYIVKGSYKYSDTLATCNNPAIGVTETVEYKNIRVELNRTGNQSVTVRYYYNGNLVNQAIENFYAGQWLLKLRLRSLLDGSSVRICLQNIAETLTFFSQAINNSTRINVPWVSSVVDTSIFNNWSSARVKIPDSISQLQTGWTLTDFLNELDRIWTGAGEDNIIIEDGGDTPVPPVPVPDTPLGEVPFDDWVDLWGQGIYQQLENQSDALDLIGSNGEDQVEELESIDSNLGDLNQTAESIDTNIGIGNGILGGIRSLAQSAVDFLEGIAEHVEELVEEIVEGTETLIAGILNQIPQAFGIIFGPIKQASSIWHYVVEWIQSIGAPFQFIWSMASGTSYYIILPVYASLAAAVVLAFYKRFGK